MVIDILPKRLRECREKMKYRQIDVAVYSDITEAAYHKVSVDYLVGLTDNPEPYTRAEPYKDS